MTGSGARRLDVGVIGGGTAGSAAALLLARAGHRVTLYERVPEPGPVGAGIVLQPSGMYALARLGLVEEVVRRGAPIHRLRCETVSGRMVLDLSYNLVSDAFYGLGIHRGVIFQSLFDAVKRERDITVRLGVGIEDLETADGDRNHVLEIGSGARHGPHELIVVADGARSRLRDDTEVRKRIRPYAWGALWFVGDDPEHRFRDQLFQVVNGTRRLIGLLPTGLGPTGHTPKASLFWSIRCDQLDAWRAAGLEPWKRELLSYVPQAGTLLEQIQHPEQVLFSQYHDVVMRPWNTRNVVYLGDAAHAMSPQLGQGCNLALVDALVLSECLEGGGPLAAALDTYSRRRRAHLGFYQLATRWLTPFFQSDLVPLGWLRDALMGLACRTPWVNRQMVLSMCGTSLGPFSPPLPLGSPPPALSPGL
ncbi:MAG TPA: NAD(P)/FAD-dependent oxidoreductase [Myxococcaceae bacterium]|nr:NAD(P)/FAD-dependent oxidoreductase [Myxococcaceae bacterium]